MGDVYKFEPSDPFGRFVEIAEGVEALHPARAAAKWSADAPNPLVIIGVNASGKTTLLRMLVDLAQRSAPDKQIVWLGDHAFSRPPTSDRPPSISSTSERIVSSLADNETLTADMLVIPVEGAPVRFRQWRTGFGEGSALPGQPAAAGAAWNKHRARSTFP